MSIQNLFTTNSFDIKCDNLTTKGNMTINGNSTISGSLTIQGSLVAPDITYEQIDNILSTANSTNITTGALICAGGAGIAKDTYIGGSINSGNNINSNGIIYANSLACNNIITTTSNTIDNAFGTINITGGGDTIVHLFNPNGAGYQKNGLVTRIYNSKSSGSLNIRSSNDNAYASNIPIGSIVDCVVVDYTQDPLHSFTNPRIYGMSPPYYTNVYISTNDTVNGSTGTLLTTTYVTSAVSPDNYSMLLTFSFNTGSTVFPANGRLCIGPIHTPTIGSSISFVACSSTLMDGTKACYAKLTTSDPTYIYITGPYGTNYFPTGDHNLILYDGSYVRYRFRPNEF